MFTKSYQLFSILGFRIGIDLSWFFLAALIVWSLATGFFPDIAPGLTSGVYYLMAAVAAAGMFASIIFHELAHAIVARHYKIKIVGITLFIFGGVAELEDEPPTAKSEFLVAVAGPISSILLAGALILVGAIAPAGAGPEFFTVLNYLSTINIVLAVFNLIPAFPLDGGRMLRAGLWWLKGSLRKATRIAAILGAALGIGLMAFGAYNTLQGMTIGGMWQMLIGFFIFNAAGSAQQQTEVMEILRGLTVGQLMRAPPPGIPGEITVEQVTSHPDLSGRDVLLPVVDGGRVIGLADMAVLEKIPPERQARLAIRDAARPLKTDDTLSPEDSAVRALRKLGRMKANEALVMRDGRLEGWIRASDIFALIDSRMASRKDEAGQTAG